MEIQIIDSIEGLICYRAEWENMLKEMNNDIVFLELDWLMLWWKFFGGRQKLFVLLITDGQEIAGICPLMKTNKGFYDEINFLGGRQSIRNSLIFKDKYKEQASECLYSFLGNLKGKNIIKLHGLVEKSENYRLLTEYLTANKAAFTSSSIVSYYINLKDSNFNDYYQNRFGKETRYKINKKEKKLKNLGNLVYRKISESEIDEAFDIHDKRWLRKIGNSSFSKGDIRKFYKELASKDNKNFNITVAALILNNRILSFIYEFEYNGIALLYRIAHDDDFNFLSPGLLLLRKKIEESYISKMDILDFGPGYEPFKSDWTDDHDNLLTIVMPSNNLASRLIFYIKYWLRIKVIDILKKNKRISNFKKYHLGKLKFLVSRENITDKTWRMKRSIKQNGLIKGLIKHCIDLTNKIYNCKQYIVLVKDIKNTEIIQDKISVREATIDDIDALSIVMNESTNQIVRRLVNKNKCYITIQDCDIIHYCWVSLSGIEISGIKLGISFDNLDAYIYDSYIEKTYRGEHVYNSIYSSLFNILYKNGFKRCYVSVNSCSKAFENEIAKKIFKPRYKVLEIRLFKTAKYNIIDLKQNGNS